MFDNYKILWDNRRSHELHVYATTIAIAAGCQR